MRFRVDRAGSLALVVVWSAIACDGGENEDEGPAAVTRRYESGVNKIVITTSEGIVRLEGSDTRILDVTYRPDREGDTFQGNPSGGVLALGSVCRDGSIGCGGTFDVSLPRNTEFEIATETGDITLIGMGFGGVLDTLTGRVLGEDLGAMNSLVVTSQDGNQNLSFREAPELVEMDSGGSGNLTIALPGGDYQFMWSTSGRTTFESGSVGNICNVGSVIDMATTNGDITIRESN